MDPLRNYSPCTFLFVKSRGMVDGDRGLFLRVSQVEWSPFEFRVVRGKLFDLEKLVFIHVGKYLRDRSLSRPPYFQVHNLRGFAQADMLL